MGNETIEKLANLEHVQWQNWAGSVCGDLEVLLEIIAEHVSVEDLDLNHLEVIEKATSRVERWPELMVDYEKLSEEMKEKDREYARKAYEICKNEF
ncbi:MAG: hypothetical protein IJF83_09850 [Methanobrevibacter sp.]|nr:hypothetical protein [Methanobrevibacter sp.]